MRETKNVPIANGYGEEKSWNVVEFDSLREFYDYICKTPTNAAFKTREAFNDLASMKVSKNGWSGTETFEEAVELFRNGWTPGAKELNQKLKTAELNTDTQMVYKNILSVCGYQAIVPLYLQGIPNNMVNKKIVPVKNKVITINKVISVSGTVPSEILKQESVKCFQIIKKIEASGIRVNLNLMIGAGHVCIKIRLKSSSEKLNVSKLAFPLVHPAMFRRLYFRFIETYPTIPKKFTHGYGYVPSESQFKSICGKNEIVLPSIIRAETEEEIITLDVEELIERLK